MRPALSVILLTTLIGAGQGLFFALYGVEIGARLDLVAAVPPLFYAAGCALSAALLAGGLAASFFHLGHPERAWRAAAMWRTSWLSREVIVLPVFMAAVAVYGAAHWFGWDQTLVIGAIAAMLCLALFVCTAMIYACLKFLPEWHTPLTPINYFALGTASGLMLAAAFATYTAPPLAGPLGIAAVAATLLASLTRGAALLRNARIRPKSNLQTAIGAKHPRIVQISQGQMGGSFNTREFFHGKTLYFVRAVKWVFLLFAFLLPVLLTAIALKRGLPGLLQLAFVVQFLGLLAERWFFFAQARHPQNIYYQVIS
jgi:DMSO reductase anchor subunit